MPWPHNILADLDASRFLAEYWQKQPLLIRGAVRDFNDPIEPDELAGLACEEGIASRLIIEKDAATPWQVSHGPFDDADFAALPDTHWTLLVQDMNRYVPELASLLDCFNFVPGWRVDDVMVSYAPPFGTVGPHTDNYDVFLLQGMGRRRWQINARPDAPATLVDGLDLRILEQFESEQEWVLEPGDMLYLPPGVQHYGVALQDCLTYSIGFRAPDRNELLGALADWLGEQDDACAPRYTDPDLQAPRHPGQVSADDIRRLRDLLDTARLDDWQLTRWFTGYSTRNVGEDTAYFDNDPVDSATLADAWQHQQHMTRNPLSRFAFAHHQQRLLLCIDGECDAMPIESLDAVQLLCDNHRIGYDKVAAQLAQPTLRQYWLDWYLAGHIGIDSDD